MRHGRSIPEQRRIAKNRPRAGAVLRDLLGWWPRWAVVAVLALVLTGCATGPRYDTDGVEIDLSPEDVVAEPDAWVDSRVIWGGRILGVEHLEDETVVEMIAYPLDRHQGPLVTMAPTGRYLVDYPGFLETADFGDGRRLTVTGSVTAVREGRVGERTLAYPVVEPDDLYLWPEYAERRPAEPRVRFGVGIMITR